MSQPSYHEYVRDEHFAAEYLAYQERWSTDIRESDRVLLSLVSEAAEQVRALGRRPSVIDIGCSTGNLLRHLGSALTDVDLAGAELSTDALVACRSDPTLEAMAFHQMDVVNLPADARYDVAIVNAVLYLLSDDDLASAFSGLSRLVQPGGALVVFDYFHDFPHDIAVIERSRSHPDGLPLHLRPMERTEPLLRDAGFDAVRFLPFQIPIDLPPGARYGNNDSGFEDLNSYTVRAEDGRRLLFRGALFQPWCHLVARKAS